MKLKTLLLLLVLLTIVACKQAEGKREKMPDAKTDVVRSKKIAANSIDWVDAINDKNTKALEKNYAAHAIAVITADSVCNGSAQIAKYYTMRKNKITALETLFKVEANEERGIHYELLRYETDSLQEYVQLVIWKKEANKAIREFEFAEASNAAAVNVDTTEIAHSRKLWMQLCNAHDAEKLVIALYSPNTIYFNHKPLVRGMEDLIKEYAYMNNENYSLQLHPLTLRVVNANFAFEIGQCSGSYNGKYILVWKKDANGNWKIFIDSNI
ncbi:MAG: hypothetical protein ABJN95_16610 [Maribacter sp.]|uniref:YybH family protein n=1 Tax=Maribacter sp. TaxID=1897614 RepID=UPI00329A438D